MGWGGVARAAAGRSAAASSGHATTRRAGLAACNVLLRWAAPGNGGRRGSERERGVRPGRQARGGRTNGRNHAGQALLGETDRKVVKESGWHGRRAPGGAAGAATATVCKARARQAGGCGRLIRRRVERIQQLQRAAALRLGWLHGRGQSGTSLGPSGLQAGALLFPCLQESSQLGRATQPKWWGSNVAQSRPRPGRGGVGNSLPELTAHAQSMPSNEPGVECHGERRGPGVYAFIASMHGARRRRMSKARATRKARAAQHF